MNWYKKIAGVEDFYSGAVKNITNQFPDREEDLTQEQIDYLRYKMKYSDIYTADLTNLFKKYPSHIHYFLYNLSEYIKRNYWNNPEIWNDDIKSIVSLIKRKKSTYLSSNLPSELYKEIMSHPEEWNIDEKQACDVFKYPQGYPDFFINWLAEKFPEAYSAKNDSIENIVYRVKNFLEFGSTSNYNMMSMMNSSLYPSVNASVKEKSKKRKARDKIESYLYKFLLNFNVKNKYIEKVIEKKRNMHRSFSGKGQEVYELSTEILRYYNSKTEYEDQYSPFSLFFDYSSTSIGTLGLLYFLEYKINLDVLNNIINLSEKNMENYVRIEYEKERIIFVIELDNEEKIDLCESISQTKNYDSISRTGSVEAMLYLFEPRDDITKNLYLNWFNENLEEHKRNHTENEFYASLVNDKILEGIIEDASSVLGSLYISGAGLLKEEDYDPDKEYNWSEKFPFILNLANEIIEKIPVNIRLQMHLSTWYALCSGKMPCQYVYERAMKYPSDTLKIIDYVSCTGSLEEINLVKEQIRKEAQQIKIKSDEELIEKFPYFVSKPDNVKIAKIMDFQELYSYAVNLIKRHFDDTEKNWSTQKKEYISNVDFILEKLENIIIYIINPEKIKQYFGNSVLENAGISPDQAKGLYIPKYRFSDKNDIIIVYTKEIDKELEPIIKDVIGLESEPTKEELIENVGNENTLWHEVAHSIFSSFTSYEETKELSQWMQSPNELLAIQYGNLAHLKNKLYNFFKNNIPASAKIEAGLTSYLEAEIVETFAWEFQGMNKEQALKSVRENMEDFKEQVVSSRSSMTKNEVVNLLTSIFLKFLMGKTMRGKAEDEIQQMERALLSKGKNIEFKEEVLPPEQYQYRPVGQKDNIITRLETRPDYISFINKVKNLIPRLLEDRYERNKERLKFYLHKNSKVFKEPREFSDLLALMFEPPSSVISVDLKNTNRFFENLIPPSLMNEVTDIVEKKRISLQAPIQEKKQIISPDEAEEAGEFMAETEEEYGPDWVWLANSKNWYKKAKFNNSPN